MQAVKISSCFKDNVNFLFEVLEREIVMLRLLSQQISK